MTPLAFVDTETTGLDPIRHAVWEIAVIRREDDGTETEHLWQIRPTKAELRVAEPKALEINRYYERIAVPDGAPAANMLAHGGPAPMDYLDAARDIFQALDGGVLIASNPHFDASFLHRLLQTGRTPWHYRPYDIVQLAAMKIGAEAAGPLPWDSKALSRAVGVEPPAKGEAHTALGDARWHKAVHDAATSRTGHV